MLHALLATPARANQAIAGSEERPIVVTIVTAISDIEDAFKFLPGHEKHRFPRRRSNTGNSWPPLAAGLLRGRSERFLEVANGFEKILDSR